MPWVLDAAFGRGCWFCEVGEPIDLIETRGRAIGICLECVRRFTGWSTEAWEDHRAPYRNHLDDRLKAAIEEQMVDEIQKAQYRVTGTRG